jgi:hypothetical protein
MGSFIFSTAIAFVVYEFLAFMRPPAKNTYTLSVGEIAVAFGPTATILARYIFLAALASGLLFFVLGLHRFSPFQNVNVALGFICGPALGIWLNSIIRLPPNEGLHKGQIIGGIGLVVLFILGSVGNEGVELIKRYSSHISSLKFGIAEFSFTGKSRSDGTPGAPSTAPAGTGGKTFSSSQGLQYVSNLGPWFIDRDRQYLKLFMASNSALEGKLGAVNKFAEEVIDPPLSCLSNWSQTAVDAISIGRHLRSYAEIFRYLPYLKNDMRRRKFVDLLLSQSQLLASDAEMFAASTKDDTCKQTPKPSEVIEKDIDALDDHEFEERPYLAIAQASVMAQLAQYPAAGAILDNWLTDKNAHRTVGNWPTSDDWFELRTRSVLAAYTEEWVERDEANVTTTIRDEHLSNLDLLRRGLRRLVTTSGFFSTLLNGAVREGSFELKIPSTCLFHDEGGRPDLWRKLFTSYISIELTYDQNTLLYPANIYDERFAEQTTKNLRALVQSDLSCVTDDVDSKVLYAEILEAFARNAIMYAGARQETESDSIRKNRLNDAMRATLTGLEIVMKSAELDQAHLGRSYISRIAASDALATKEALIINQRRLKALTEE